MNKFIYFMVVGLAFTVLQVTTVEAQDTAAGLVTGGNAPADCGGVPCPTGDDAHTGGAQDCANAPGGPEAVAACWDRQASHADSAHGGMAPGTTAMCGDVPCPTGDDAHTGGGEDCANAPGGPEAVAACWDRQASHADSAHGGMAPGTTAMCGDVPCTSAGATSGGN